MKESWPSQRISFPNTFISNFKAAAAESISKIEPYFIETSQTIHLLRLANVSIAKSNDNWWQKSYQQLRIYQKIPTFPTPN